MNYFAAVSYHNKKIISALEQTGLIPIKVFPYRNNTDTLESSHADMQMLILPHGEIFLIKDNEPFNSSVADCVSDKSKIKYTKSAIEIFKYPHCTLLNVLIVGNNVLCNTKYTDEYLLDYLFSQNYNIIHVNQGYAKCSCAAISASAIITSDKGISAAARSHGISVLEISPLGIALCDKYEGFIGGASFMISDNKIAFIGNIDQHGDSEKIRDFCMLNRVEAEILCPQLPPTDIGGVVIF
ncbi:MAG: hypothetical protein IIY78_08585 [Clostridia bacterium]|nr:hypothetical protein [Clostridia bacterium]